MARAQKSGTTAPGEASDDLAADHARLLLEVQRLRLECQGLRHDHGTAARDRDRLLQENIALRQGEPTRQREADLRRREAALAGRDHSRDIELGSLRRQLETSDSQLRMAQLRLSILEMECGMLRMHAHDPGEAVPRGEIAHQLRELIRLCHPDKWQDAAVATELVKHLNALRAQYTT